MDDNIERGAWSGGVWSRRSSNYDVGKFREVIAMMACSFLQVEEMYPDQEKHLEHF